MTSELITVTAYDEFREEVEKVKETCNFIPDVSTDDGYKKSKRVALDVGKILTSLEKARKDLKSESLATGKRIDSEARSIVATLEEFQLPHKEAYKELDQLKKQREQDRKDTLAARVDEFRNMPEMMADMDSGSIKGAMEDIAANECLDFYEFTEQALKARNAAKAELSKMFAAKLQQEKDSAELVELRKKQDAQDKKDFERRIAKEASAKADAEASIAKAAEAAAIQLAAEAVTQREAAELKAKQDAEVAELRRQEAEQQAKKDAQAAEAKAVEDAIAAKMAAEIAAGEAAEAARLAQIQAQKDADAAALAETANRGANNKHVGEIRKAAKESLMSAGLDEAMAKKIVLAIHAGKIANVSIQY